MKYLVTATLIVVGVIHLLPLSGVLGSARLTSLYGLDFNEKYRNMPDIRIYGGE